MLPKRIIIDYPRIKYRLSSNEFLRVSKDLRENWIMEIVASSHYQINSATDPKLQRLIRINRHAAVNSY